MPRSAYAAAFTVAFALIALSQVHAQTAGGTTLAAQQPTAGSQLGSSISPLVAKQPTGDGDTGFGDRAAAKIAKHPTGDGDTGFGDRATMLGRNPGTLPHKQ